MTLRLFQHVKHVVDLIGCDLSSNPLSFDIPERYLQRNQLCLDWWAKKLIWFVQNSSFVPSLRSRTSRRSRSPGRTSPVLAAGKPAGPTCWPRVQLEPASRGSGSPEERGTVDDTTVTSPDSLFRLFKVKLYEYIQLQNHLRIRVRTDLQRVVDKKMTCHLDRSHRSQLAGSLNVAGRRAAISFKSPRQTFPKGSLRVIYFFL